jgi:hypothetical protein
VGRFPASLRMDYEPGAVTAGRTSGPGRGAGWRALAFLGAPRAPRQASRDGLPYKTGAKAMTRTDLKKNGNLLIRRNVTI